MRTNPPHLPPPPPTTPRQPLPQAPCGPARYAHPAAAGAVLRLPPLEPRCDLLVARRVHARRPNQLFLCHRPPRGPLARPRCVHGRAEAPHPAVLHARPPFRPADPARPRRRPRRPLGVQQLAHVQRRVERDPRVHLALPLRQQAFNNWLTCRDVWSVILAYI